MFRIITLVEYYSNWKLINSNSWGASWRYRHFTRSLHVSDSMGFDISQLYCSYTHTLFGRISLIYQNVVRSLGRMHTYCEFSLGRIRLINTSTAKIVVFWAYDFKRNMLLRQCFSFAELFIAEGNKSRLDTRELYDFVVELANVDHHI